MERSVRLDEIDLNSDRWVVPLAIAINSENPFIGPEIMERISSTDPGIAGLVLEEVKHNWSLEEPMDSLPPGTAIEIGTSIRNAMENWKEGLGPLMPALGILDKSGNIPTLGIDVRPGWVTTSWHRGDETLASVVQLPEDLDDHSARHFWNWPAQISRGIEPTKVWPWSITHEDLSESLSRELSSLRFALDSTVGFHEFAYEFSSYLRRYHFDAKDLKDPAEVINYIESYLSRFGSDPRRSITFGTFGDSDYTFTDEKLELFRERVLELNRSGRDISIDPWPAPDKEGPQGKSGGMWFEFYTEEKLLQRTNAMFNGALQIYNEIMERLLPAFKKRNQMRYSLPFRMRGELRLLEASNPEERTEANLTYWHEWASDSDISGIFIELGPKDRAIRETTQKRIQAARDEFFERGMPFYSGSRILPGYEPRPATRLAHSWLTDDLQDLHWSN